MGDRASPGDSKSVSALRRLAEAERHVQGQAVGMAFSMSMRKEPPSTESLYVFDNAEVEQARRRFAGLPLIFDPGTIRVLSERGVGPGWSCLEVGGGGGSVAAWLAERVGPTGFVLVTDIDTRFLEAMHAPNLEVQRHDIATDPLPESAFDLVHTRLVLQHVPGRDEALARMAAALKAGRLADHRGL